MSVDTVQNQSSVEITTTNKTTQAFLENIASELDKLDISSEDIKAEIKAIKERTKGILWEDVDFMMSIKTVVLEKLQLSLDNLKFPRHLNYLYIEEALDYIRKYLESRWHEFKQLDYPNVVGDSDEFEANFARDIIEMIIEKYLSSYPVVERKNNKWKKKRQLKQLPPKLANILHEPIFEELLMSLWKNNFMKISDNISNKLTKEKEYKILDVDKEELKSRLEDMEWVKKTFEWHVTDTYYDFPDNRLSDSWEDGEQKSSFRIRQKEGIDGKVRYYYTVKRKDKDSSNMTWIRDCWEEEFEITQTDVHHIQNILRNFGMHEYKAKTKYRTSYEDRKNNVKFDIDEYDGMEPLLEIEAESIKEMQRYEELLWVVENEKFSWGTSSLKERAKLPYWKYEEKRPIQVDE